MAAVVLLFIEASLTLVGFRRTCALISAIARRARPRCRGAIDGFGLRSASRTVVSASHHWAIAALGVDCVAESLLLLGIAEANGRPARVRFGVATREPFEAHAWLEDDDGPVNDSSDVEGRLFAFPAEHDPRMK